MGHNTLAKVTIGQFVLKNYGALNFVMDMFINIRYNYAFQQNSKKSFVNNFCVSEP